MRAVSASEEVLHRLYAHICRDLSYRYDGVYSFESVARVVAEVRADLDSRARIKDFLPVLTQRVAHDVLRDAARPTELGPRPSVLFVCSRSAGRSQLAASLTRRLAGPRVTVRTAGEVPTSVVEDEVVLALAELEVRIADDFPVPLTEDVVRAADVGITLGGGDACPIRPGRRYRDWDVLNPSGQDLDTVRVIRDDVQTRVRGLVSELSAGSPV